MSAAHAARLLIEFADTPEGPWDGEFIQYLSRQTVPDLVFLGRRTEAVGEATVMWLMWFLHGCVDLARLPKVDYANAYAAYLRSLRRRLSDTSVADLRQLTRAATRLALRYWSAERRRREAVDGRERRSLVAGAGHPPRCWICGFPFRADAIDRFLGGSASTLEPGDFVDFFAPRRDSRHMRVEVDHVFPLSRGGPGGANLRLACGRCNAYKGNALTVYDADVAPIYRSHPRAGYIASPRPVWLVRAMAGRARCEFTEGCEATVSDAELFVAPRDIEGAWVPTNLQVTCQEHDPVKDIRWVARRHVLDYPKKR